jgi:hypothetical protein
LVEVVADDKESTAGIAGIADVLGKMEEFIVGHGLELPGDIGRIA